MQKDTNKYINILELKDIFSGKFKNVSGRIIVNGGEPTLNPDLIEILEYASKYLGLETYLFTNGRLLSNIQYAEKIVKSGVNKITIPIYGHVSSLHNRITRNSTSFQETTRGINNLNELKKERKFELELKILICKENNKYIKDIAEYIFKNFTPDILLVSGLIPSKVAVMNRQIVTKEEQVIAINIFFDYFATLENKPRLILDGIPICHLNDKNKMIYMFNRLCRKELKEKKFSNSYYVDVSNCNKIISETEIVKWDTSICPQSQCKYKNICRLNTLIDYKEFVKEWL